MNQDLLINNTNSTRSPTYLSHIVSVSSKTRGNSTVDSEFRQRDRSNIKTFVDFTEQKRKFGYDSVVNNIKRDFDSRSTESSRITRDGNKFINKNNYNQINVHIHNYNNYDKDSFKNSFPHDNAFIESTERDNIGNMYETPRGSVVENCLSDRKK
jgi:hypothetical protein